MMHPVVALTLEKVGVQGSVISTMAKMSTLDPMRVSMDIAKTRIAVIYFFIFTDSSSSFLYTKSYNIIDIWKYSLYIFISFARYAMKEAMTTRRRKMKDAKKDKHIIPENCSKTIQM